MKTNQIRNRSISRPRNLSILPGFWPLICEMPHVACELGGCVWNTPGRAQGVALQVGLQM
jgi:hypothetical protein